MDRKKYERLRAAVVFFVSAIIVLAVIRDSYLLATAGVLTGMVFLMLVRKNANIRTDEREAAIQEKAARMAYAIFAPTIGFAAFFLLLPSRSGFSVFRNGEWVFTESLGMVLAYLTLFLITMYAVSYHFLNRKYGGGSDEE